MLTFLPMALLLTLPTTATAFLLGIYRNHAPRERIFALQAAEHLICFRVDKLRTLLEKKRQELLSDASKLREQHPQSTVAADNEMRDALTAEQMVQEALLSARLHLPFLHRTKLGPSNIEGAGRGLFAAENITEGDLITCYPGDLLLCEITSSDDKNDDIDENDEDFEYDFEEEDDYSEEILLWGAHVPSEDRCADDDVFDGTESTPPLTSYAVSVDDCYSVMGLPSLDDNPAYYGHFANDGAGHLALEKANSQNNIQAAIELGLDTEGGIGVEENIASYVLKSLEVANAMHKTPDDKDLHMMTVATRDIEEGEEILVTYGPDYWAGHA